MLSARFYRGLYFVTSMKFTWESIVCSCQIQSHVEEQQSQQPNHVRAIAWQRIVLFVMQAVVQQHDSS